MNRIRPDSRHDGDNRAVMTFRARTRLARTVVAALIAGMAVTGLTLPATASLADDPACEWLGWRHPACAGGLFENPPDDGIPGDNAAEGGIPAPAMVPNVDGSMSPPGTPGAV
jgi:hypothetical protein